MSKTSNLCLSLIAIIIFVYVLFDFIKSCCDPFYSISVFSIAIIIVWIITALLLALLWLYFSWSEITEDYNT